MRNKLVLHTAAAQFTLGCMLASFYYLMTVQTEQIGRAFPLALLPCGPAVYLLNRQFLRKPRSMLALGALNIGTAAVLCAVFCLIDGWMGIAPFLFVAAFTLALCIKGASYVFTPLIVKDLLLLLDGSFALVVLCAGFLGLTGHPMHYCLVAICGMAVALLNLAAMRSNRPLGVREWLFLAAAFLTVAGGMLLLTGAAAPMGQAIVALWNGTGSVLLFLMNSLYRLLLWLTPPAPDYSEEEPPAAALQPETEPEPVGEPNPILTKILFAVIAAAVLYGVYWLLRQLSRWKLSTRTSAAAALPEQPQQSDLPLHELLARLRRAQRTRRWLRKHRSTPLGVYFWLERRCRRTPWRKLPGETPRGFLTRLADQLQSDPVLCSDFAVLIPAADAALYSSKTDCPPEFAATARRIRRQTGRALLLQAAHKRLHRCPPRSMRYNVYSLRSLMGKIRIL
ncbi:MAG: hypothetical protein IJ347_08805 [Faecalibacterium sp.]|nr:hypothetical protein [Faecalibacterium sp.]